MHVLCCEQCRELLLYEQEKPKGDRGERVGKQFCPYFWNSSTLAWIFQNRCDYGTDRHRETVSGLASASKTKDHILDGLNNKIWFLLVLKVGKSKLKGSCPTSFLVRALCLLIVCAHSGGRGGESLSLSPSPSLPLFSFSPFLSFLLLLLFLFPQSYSIRAPVW